MLLDYNRSVCRWIILLALAACLKDPTVPCGDITCPAGNICTSRGTCATPEQVAACSDLDDGAQCLSNTGVCVDDVCRLVVCGDGEIVGPEACDDGNQRAGDDCSADCRSLEVCGNGYPDFVKGEECDNAPAGLSYDGCTSDCRREYPAWRDASPALPTVRNEFAFAHDHHRGRTMMFGGNTQESVTWEWDGEVWRRFTDAPSPRNNAVAAYDSERREIVMFGGQTNAIGKNETWIWNGGWTKRLPATSPPARWNVAMAYDPVRKEVVLFGGDDKGFTDTWVWNGVTWTEKPTATKPAAFGDNLMAWDASGSQLLLYQTTFGTTWTWNGTAWTQSAASSPSMRPNAAMASDGAGVILFGGGNSTTNVQTWRWINGAWTLLAPPQSATGRAAHQMAYDVARARVVLFGGSSSPAPTNDVWEWTGSTWVVRNVKVSPTHRTAAIAYQPLRGRSLLFGGSTNDVWEWDGSAWIERFPATVPGPKNNASLIGTREGALLFGGGPIDGNETWTWNGTTWTKRTTATVPASRFGASLAYDSLRNRVVMFGGATGSVPLDETWVWDGVDWMQQTPTRSPSARTNAAMAYDSRRDRVVLFGGSGGSATDTWEWDGTNWNDVTPMQMDAVSPPPQSRAHGAYDARRGTFIMLGTAFGANDVWEWNGTEWREMLIANRPVARFGPAITYDAARGEAVMFSGGINLTDTQVLRFGVEGEQQERCIDVDTDADALVGCDDPDCWARCTPLCPPLSSCDVTAPRCGDQSCSIVEDNRLCPSDCP